MDSPSASPRCLSLQELCLRNAIDNLDLIRDAGQLDAQFLRVILSHCTAEQLLRIEQSTKATRREQDELQKECVKSLTEKYTAAGEQEARRQLQQTDLAPPTSKKRRQSRSIGEVASSARFTKGSSTPVQRALDCKRRTAAARKKPVVPVRSAGLGGRR